MADFEVLKSRILTVAAALTLLVLSECSSLPRTEIDCSHFSGATLSNDITPPAESDTVDTKLAERMITRKAYPKYPERAMRAGLQGTVWVKLWIGRNGIVKNAYVVKSDAEIFNEASLEAARKLEFSPASCGGTPVSVWATIPIRFKLLD